MKIVLEVTDEQLHALVQAQVGKAVAEYTDKVIEGLVADIVKTKLERLDRVGLPGLMEKAATALLDKELGNGNHWAKQQALRNFLADAAVRALKEAR